MLHEPYCIRSLKFCEICTNVIEISEFDEHTMSHKEKTLQSDNDSKLQSTVINPIPNTDINKPKIYTNSNSSKLEENINLKRLESAKLICEYCELLLSESEFYDHIVMCGARSTKCEFCNNKFLYKQMKSHLNDCAAKMLLEQNAFEDDFTGILI